MDLETNQNENNLLVKYNSNEPFLGICYPKIMSYILNYENGVYCTIISDVRVQYIEKINLKITLPEIIGKGVVSYKKYYPYHLIKYIEIYLKNTKEDEILLTRADNDELLMNLLSKNNSSSYLNHCSGEYDNFCIETEGTYNDCIIFPERTIEIPIELLTNHIKIFPETVIKFVIELNPLNNIIIYNTVFEKKSLESYINKNKNRNLNFKLEFENTIIYHESDNENIYSPVFFLRKKKTIGQNNASNLNTQEFKNCFCIKFLSKTNIFTENNRFIINTGVETSEKNLLNKWISKILKDLIIVTDLNMEDPKNKELYGFDRKARFVEVIDNTVKFEEDKNKQCKIFIELVPENYKIYYHTNILTYSRRYKYKDMINISNMFKYIKGICFYEDNINIKFFLEDIKHDITIDYISIPVNIWSHTNNTSDGDLRSSISKSKDYIYNNEFILGLDYLSKDTGYNNISISAGRDVFDHFLYESKFDENTLKYYKIIEYDKNNYPNITLLNLSTFKRYIICDDRINFTRFLIKINWKKYPDHDPKSLYNLIPYAYLYELMIINYDKNNNIYLKPIEKKFN